MKTLPNDWNMKTTLLCLTTVFVLAAHGPAAPLPREQVPADAKWLLHLDLDNLRGTQVGQFLFSQFIDAQFEQMLANLKQNFSIDLDLKKIHALTAYGSSYQSQPEANGVVAIQTSLKLGELLEDLLNRQTNLTKTTAGPLKKIQQNPFVLFSLKDEVYLVPVSSSVLLLSKSRSQLENAVLVAQGKSKSLARSRAFSDFPSVADTFFFLGVAEGFSPEHLVPGAAGGTNALSGLMPQAKILQLADGGRAVLGEKGNQLFLNVALKAKTADGAAQMQQVIQGVLALVALSKAGDSNSYLPPISVSTNGQVVSVLVEYPVTNMLKMIALKNPGIKLNLNLEKESKGNQGATN
jgi:hypothetical protein